MGGQAEERAAIVAMGRALGPDVLASVQALYRAEQERLAANQPVTAADIAYGDRPRQRLDCYAPQGASGLAPVLLWVHGGGFLRGDKQSGPFNAHAARWAARSGLLGVAMNYRLAPDSVWPSGAEDVGAAVRWLQAHASGFGGDPARIFAVGTSAGAVHVAGHLNHAAGDTGLAGAVLLSGLYGFEPLEERDQLYYGAPDLYGARAPRDALVATDVPLLVAASEYDPPRFQAETLGLLSARLAAKGHMPRAFIAPGHNHFSMAYHLGTGDTRLADEILTFIGDHL